MVSNEQKEKVLAAIKKIVDAGGNAEVRKNKDGTWNVYEVKKSIKCIMSSLNRVHIETGVKDVISAYINGIDITATNNEDEELPFN